MIASAIIVVILLPINAINTFDHDYVSYMHIEKTSTFLFDMIIKWNCERLPANYDMSSVNNIVDFENMRYNSNSRNNYTLITGNDYDRSKGLTYINLMGTGNWTCTYPFLPRLHFGFHFSYHPDNPKEKDWMMNGTVATVFRKPINRLISAFLFNKGGMLGIHQHLQIKDHQAVREKILASQYPIYNYSQETGIPSCQTKMVLGHPCMTPYVLIKSDIAVAKERLRGFSFIGLTEDSVATALLFTKMYGEGRKNSSVTNDDASHRRVNRLNDHATHEKLVQDLQINNWVDDYDEAIYAEAVAIFCRNCRKYDVKTTINCAG